MSWDRAAAVGTAPRPRPTVPQGAPLLAVGIARLLAFAALATFGATQWGQLVEPSATLALLGCLAAGLAGGVLLIWIGARARGTLACRATTLLVALALLIVALLAAGTRPALVLDPRGWGEIARGIGDGLATLPTARVPYAGPEQWTRIVIVLGGGAVMALGAVLAFAPRRCRALGFRYAAAVALGTLYGVPAVEREVDHPFRVGVVFALLLACLLWLERLRRESTTQALLAVAGAAIVALAAAPALDADGPLVDYEEFGRSLGGGVQTSYDWNHRYGPLDWPRDGREVLRIKAARRAYWKATNLTAFDGVRWLRDPRQRELPLDTPLRADRRDWRDTLRVQIRALRSSQFVAAGTALQVSRSPRLPIQVAPGVFGTENGHPLKRGNSYRARVYVPNPSAREMRASAPTGYGTPYPDAVRETYSRLVLPPRDGTPPRTAGKRRVAVVALWGDRGMPGPREPSFAGTSYARAYALARRLRARAATPYDYMRAVERHLADDFSYSETPPRTRAPLDTFLFEQRIGYCQQFSGAMALLLRLGGVPARIAAGFAPGGRSAKRGGQYIVRDIDAHSWVEVFFPAIGWVTRDPTPAGSPARSQAADLARPDGDSPAVLGGAEGRAQGNGDRADRGATVPAARGKREDGSWTRHALPAGAIALATIGLLLALRRRALRRHAAAGADPQLAELTWALRLSGRAAQPSMTLDRLARGFGGTPAEAYVRQIAAARYGYGAGGPTRAQRAALRRHLGRSHGTLGVLRAWWALPPRLRS